MKLNLPVPVEKAFKQLESCGFCGYLVGGCVRDFLLGTWPTDFDMTTDATPDEIIACFAGHRVVETGIRHGTVTVMIEGMAIEITTHRIEGDYSVSISMRLEAVCASSSRSSSRKRWRMRWTATASVLRRRCSACATRV